ncbi:transporter substrate-binding domain-containing protein, partial [Xanthovirga aplysinae]|uniref:transporter substrate-binding domain-containing protein n=1 Tax=Xanthovirga aplysinae TaxID=2529853 RepID=UPI001656D128
MPLYFLSLGGFCSEGNFYPKQRSDKKVIVYGGDRDFAPFEFLDEDGKPDGFFIDLLTEIGKVSGYEFKFVLKSWPETYKEFTQDSAFDLSEMFYKRERVDSFEFSQLVALVDHRFLVRTKDKSLDLSEGLEGVEIVLEKNSYLEKYIKRHFPKAHMNSVGSQPEALNLLALGKYDLALVNEYVAQTIQFKPEYSGLRITGPPMISARLAFAAHKGDTALINVINEGLELLKIQQRYTEIYNKWFSIYIPKEASRSYQIMKYVRWVLGSIILLLLLAGIWIFSLRRMVKLQTTAIQNELKEKNYALAEMNKINKELDSFVYSISHDINAPIASVLGLVNIMKHDLKYPEIEG